MAYFNNEKLTNETILKARQWFHDNALACIEEARNGEVYVNDFESYSKLKKKTAKEYSEGKYDHVLEFLQRAYYIQTGKIIPLIAF